MQPKDVIEALVFASQKPITADEITAALRSAVDEQDDESTRELSKLWVPDVTAFLQQLRFEYDTDRRAFQLVEEVGGWRIMTRPEFAPWVRRLYPESKPTRLSGPALETLAVVAYRQPVTRADIEAVRGVDVGGVLQSLLERGLVRIAGRADVPGRPLLYETTEGFMQHFGLLSLDELPNVDELRRIALPTPPSDDPELNLNPEPAPEPAPEPHVAELDPPAN